MSVVNTAISTAAKIGTKEGIHFSRPVSFNLLTRIREPFIQSSEFPNFIVTPLPLDTSDVILMQSLVRMLPRFGTSIRLQICQEVGYNFCKFILNIDPLIS